MNIPNSQKSFYFDFTTEFGNRYEGTFVVKCLLNIGEKHAMELEKTRMLGNHTHPTDELIGISIILANLRHKIVEGPNWWTQSRGGTTLQEEDLLAQLYAKLQDTEVEWKRELVEKAKAAESTPQTQPSA